MQILITGAAGFLGSHICDRLIKEGHFIIGLDNFITGDKRNLLHLETNKNFQGLQLNFDPSTRSLSDAVWLNNDEDVNWEEVHSPIIQPTLKKKENQKSTDKIFEEEIISAKD